MTPAARIAEAARILDRVLSGEAAEQALTGWARASRYAGSGDRTAVRDLVYQALRRRRSYGAASGGGDAATGRQLMIGHLVATGQNVPDIYTGLGHAPAQLAAGEALALASAPTNLSDGVRLDCPDWLLAPLFDALGADRDAVLDRFRDRASVFLRVNLARVTREAAIASLAAQGIAAQPHHLAKSALEVTVNAQKIRNSESYASGLVELQDAASQALCDAIPLRQGDRVLDFCAGGGGKTLALAAREPKARYAAHDAHPRRMADLPVRAARAGADIALIETDALPTGPAFDVVVADVPCSGSGTWSRDPDAKWRLTPDRLAALRELQAIILKDAARRVSPGGTLAYLTCSLLRSENEDQVAGFLSTHSDWQQTQRRRISPTDGGDGFFMALLTRAAKVPTTPQG